MVLTGILVKKLLKKQHIFDYTLVGFASANNKTKK